MMKSINRGAGILLAVGALSVVTSTITYFTFQRMTNQYTAASAKGLAMQAKYLAETGIDIAIHILSSIPEQYLYQYDFLKSPPSLLIAEECNDQEICHLFYVDYEIKIADGKLNLNNLVRNDDEVNQAFRSIISRLFNHLRITEQKLFTLIDWMDKNDQAGLFGAEKKYYFDINQKIKNDYLYSLSEINLIRGFENLDLYTIRAPEGWRPEANLEKYISKDDWRLINNISAYLPYSNLLDGKVNVNAAPYFVLLSLSDFITKKEVREILKTRDRENNYIKDLSIFEPLLMKEGYNELTLYEELVGTGGNLSGLLRADTSFYELIGKGVIVRKDRNTGEESIISKRTIRSIWDQTSSHLTQYSIE